ncbi:MAG: hypothetical protein ACFB00_02125 [Parvularculaceae bacterium]
MRHHVIGATALAVVSSGAAGEPFSFVVIGDTPYAEEDEAMLAEAVPAIKSVDYPFIVHIGDYKGGRGRCDAAADARFAALLADLAPTPVFYTPGDNEWTDCDRHSNPETGERYSALARLALIRTTFFAEPVPAPDDLAYVRQDGQPENAAWSYAGVQFATLHVVGTNNGRDWVTGDDASEAAAATDDRDAANLAWLERAFARAEENAASAVVVAMQADITDVKGKTVGEACTDAAPDAKGTCDGFAALRQALAARAGAFGGHVLLIHGDTAPFTLNKTFPIEAPANLWRLNAAGDAGVGATGFRYGVRDVTLVTIDPNAETPFAAKGLTTDKKPTKK